MRITRAKIGDACVVGDGAHGSLKRRSNGILYLTSKNLKDGKLELSKVEYIDEPTFAKFFREDSKALTVPKTGDVIFGIIGSIGQSYLVKKGDRFGISSSIAILRPNRVEIDAKYLYHWVKGLTFQQALYAIKGGVAQSYVSLEMIRSLPLDYPDLIEQQEIAAILSGYEDLVENNTRRIQILEEMARRIYEEWFVRFRFPGHENVRMVESELGLIPDGWSVVRLEDLYKTGSGGTPSRKNAAFYGGNINWVKTQELNDGFIFETEEKLTLDGLNNSSAKIFPTDTILVAMYGATIGELAILANPSSTNQACCAVIPRREPFGFEYAFLSLLVNRSKLIDLRAGAAQQNINQVVIKRFKMLKPDDETVSAFNHLAHPILKQISILQKKIDVLCRTRNLLLPKLISGEIDVSNFREPVTD